MRFQRLVYLLALACSPSAAMAEPALSLAGATQTLDESFKEAPVWRGGNVQVGAAAKPLSDPSFSWAAGYIWNHPAIGFSDKPGFPAWTSNGSADADPNGDMIALLKTKLWPLSWSGTLHFTARPMPADLVKSIGNMDPKAYMSASISSFPYAQTYGVFAISAKVPKGKGTWPAFWLIPADKSWPPEIDVFEVLGSDPTTFYGTVHTKGPGGKDVFEPNVIHTGVDLSHDFHEYAVDWGPQTINWYFDRKLVASKPTPPDLHKPCYIIANLGIGKATSWGGAPTPSTTFPATMEVAYIRAWQREAYAEPNSPQ